MNNLEKIYLSSLSDKQLEIAKKVNKDNNDHLSGSEISIFLGECELKGVEYKPSLISKTYNGFLNLWDKGAEKVSSFLENKPKHIKHSKPLGPPISEEMEITKNAYEKWSKVFKNSPLDQNFYNKLYDVIERLNIDIEIKNKGEFDTDIIKNKNFDNIYKDLGFEPQNKTKETSTKEKVFDEVIAILAGESQLKPNAKNGPYRGLFQLADAGLKDLKTWARTNEIGSDGLNIDQRINIEGFAKLSGEEQLDYLVAYIEKMKEYSGIRPDEKITPAQMWAMIKYPFKGKDTTLIKEKNNAIKNVIALNKIKMDTNINKNNIT